MANRITLFSSIFIPQQFPTSMKNYYLHTAQFLNVNQNLKQWMSRTGKSNQDAQSFKFNAVTTILITIVSD